MQKKDLEKTDLPKKPGVYLFKKGRKVLYVGKAVDLRARVGSYFAPKHRLIAERGKLIFDMVQEAESLEFIETQSGAEAVILEANLIKKYQSEYNTKEKSDKSFNFVLITNEDFPKVKIVRGRDIKEKIKDSEIKYLFGPFAESGVLRKLLKIVRRIFPYAESCAAHEPMRKHRLGRGKACFYSQLGLCPGVCTGKISKREYAKNIRQIKEFFEGKKEKIIKNLKKEMELAAKKLDYEKAAKLRDQIFALENIKELSLIEEIYKAGASGAGMELLRIEAYDIAHMAGKARIGAMVAFEKGRAVKSDYRLFNIKSKKEGDTDALEELLQRRLSHKEWKRPDLIVIDGGRAQKNTAEKVLKELNLNIKVVSVVKDERHRPKHILGDKKLAELYKNTILKANAEAHRFAISAHRRKRAKEFLSG